MRYLISKRQLDCRGSVSKVQPLQSAYRTGKQKIILAKYSMELPVSFLKVDKYKDRKV